MPVKLVNSSGYSVDGVTTMWWGTDGLLQSPAPGGSYAGVGFYMVDSIDEAEDAEAIHGENGTGLKTWRVLLKHGKRWNITVTDDSGMAVPAVGTSITVVDVLGDKTAAYSAKIVENDWRGAKKQPGQRVLVAENLLLVDSQATT